MKASIFLAALVIISSSGLKAQVSIKVTDESLKMGNASMPGISVNIPESNYDNTIKLWVKNLESGTKSKVVTENGEMTIFGARIKEISSNPINVYSKMLPVDSAVQLVAAFEIKKDQYLNRNDTPQEFSKAQEYLKKFAKDQYVGTTKTKADAEEKKVREIERELSTLEKEKARMQKSIQSNKTTIVKENDNITIQNNEVTTVEAAIVEHNKQLDTMSTGPAKEEKVKYIKDLEKKKKNALSSIESSKNKIDKMNNDIDKMTAEIPKNDEQQAQVRSKLDKQQAVYQELEDKIKTIRSY